MYAPCWQRPGALRQAQRVPKLRTLPSAEWTILHTPERQIDFGTLLGLVERRVRLSLAEE